MKKAIYRFLILVGIANALTIIISAVTGPNAYVLANSISSYLNLVLCFIPIALTSIALIWWLVDRFLKTDKPVNYIAIAFSAILADAVFVIGSTFFAAGH